MITPDEIADASDEIRAVLESLDIFVPVIDAPERGEFTCSDACNIFHLDNKTVRAKLDRQVKAGTLSRREVVLHGRRQYLYRKV